MDNINQLKSLLSNPKKITILSHRNPDGDAIGSSLGLYHYLKDSGHDPKVIFPSEYPEFVAWLPAAETCLVHDNEPDLCNQAIEDSEVIFCLDFNGLDRVDPMAKYIKANPAPKVMIDHHLEPEDFAQYMMSIPAASSTCELIYEFMDLMGDASKMTSDIATSLFTGILTDTGSFRYSTRPETFRIAAQLQEAGADVYTIQNMLFNSMEEKVLQLLGHCLANRMILWPEIEAGAIYLTKEDYEKFDIQRGDTEGIVNYLLKMKKVRVAALIKEQPTIIKFSLRSKGDFSVQMVASEYFNGGGHKNASGGYMYGTVKKAIHTFRKAVELHWEKQKSSIHS